MPIQPSLALDFFERIKSHAGHPDSLPAVRALVNRSQPVFEAEHLDFKAGSRGGPTPGPLPDADIKKIWSEALAGFATTSGGVLIWGIDARKIRGSDVDAAVGFRLVPDPHALRSRLQELHHEATDPPVPGVEYLPIPDPSEGGQGFLVCFIPESEYKPHRVEFGGKRWVIRAGDSFVDTPVPVLRSLFFPHRQSYVILVVSFLDKLQMPDKVRLHYEVQVYNEGPATLDNLSVSVRRFSKLEIQAPHGWGSRSGDRIHVNYPRQVHPGQLIDFFKMTLELPQARDVTFDIELFAMDQMPSAYSVTVAPAQGAAQNAHPTPLAVDRFRSSQGMPTAKSAPT
jgi:hypothetical protein